MEADMVAATKKVSTIDEAAAAYGGMPEPAKALDCHGQGSSQ